MDSIHAKHRLRVKKRFLDNGLGAFSDHEVLELLIYFGIPYKNTNETAHILLNRFGTLSGVLDADFEELRETKGIGDNTAVLIKLLPQLLRRYWMDKSKVKKRFTTSAQIGEYLVNHYIGATREHVELLMFDAGMHMIDHVTVHEGAVNSSDINPELIAEFIFNRRASCFVLAHNHPGGVTKPSEVDLAVTVNLRRAFEPFNIQLLEHYVVADGKYRAILSEALSEFGDIAPQ